MRLRLAVVLMVVVTLSTALVGAWSYINAQAGLRQQRALFVADLSRQLGVPLSVAMWNYDKTAALALLEAKLDSVIVGLTVLDARGEIWLHRVWDEARESSRATEVLSVELRPMGGMPMGTLKVQWSDTSFRQAMAQTFRALVLQLLLLNVVVVAVFWAGVDRLVFRRVGALQRALDHAASRERATEIVQLPVRERDEFGALTRSINTIMERLRQELEAGMESEEEARAALTHLQNAQEGLVRAEKMAALGNLVAGVAHELNTPIGNIVMVSSTQQERDSELARAALDGTLTRKGLERYVAQACEGADLIFNNAKRAAELIQSFKQVAVDQTSERLREFDLAHQISEILTVTAPVLNKASVLVERELQSDIAMYTYPGPLGQVLTNLLTNAVCHAFENQPAGVLRVCCEAQNGWARITVQDNGCGMSEDVVGRIFDPFFTTKFGRGGSGLGLHISHNIVYGALRGRFVVCSEVGVGTTFVVELPCRLPEPGCDDAVVKGAVAPPAQ